MIEAIHYELECALDDPAAEVERLLDMQKLTYSPLSSICAQCLEEGGAYLNPIPTQAVYCGGYSDAARAPKGAVMLTLGITTLLTVTADQPSAAASSAPQGHLLWNGFA